MHALVIDDDPAIAHMVELTLQLEGFTVTVAESGADGLLAAMQEQPDVIILDVMMPDLDGWEVARRLREHAQFADVPVVFCTALGDDQSTWQGWQSGAASYVVKPFDPSRLVAEIVRAVRA